MSEITVQWFYGFASLFKELNAIGGVYRIFHISKKSIKTCVNGNFTKVIFLDDIWSNIKKEHSEIAKIFFKTKVLKLVLKGVYLSLCNVFFYYYYY